jgi:putative ABC transport system ATP-binding protein
MKRSPNGKEQTMIILKAEHLKKYYQTESTIVKALDGVDLEVEEGEFLAVIGSSGSGKTTLLHLLGGLDRPTSGTVTINNTQIHALKEDQKTIFRRRHIGFVFQDYNLVPILNVEENILLPLQLDDNEPDPAYISQILETLGLQAKRQSMPNELSGGQQQRAAIARALAVKPVLLLADEPTGNLDSRTGMDVIGLLKVSAERFGQTTIIITHNSEIAQMADRIIHIEDGRIQTRRSTYDSAYIRDRVHKPRPI